MNIRICFVMLFCLMFGGNKVHATDSDTLKSVIIQQQIVECMQQLYENANTNSDLCFVTAKKLIYLTSQYEQLTNDSMVRMCTFIGESFLAMAHNSKKELDSAYVHTQKALSLCNPYGKMLCSTDSTSTFFKMIYGCNGLWGIVRDMYVKQDNIPKALEICCLINDSCSFQQLDIELVQSYTRQGEIYELFGDYESAIRCHVNALDKRLTLSNPGEYPLASQICNNIFVMVRRFYAKQDLLVNNESLRQRFMDFGASFLNDFFKTHSFDFCKEEEKLGQTFWIRRLFDTYIYLLEDLRQYDTIFSIEELMENFYNQNYGKESLEYAEFLIMYEKIYSNYSKYVDSDVDKKRYANVAKEKENYALEIWGRFFENYPIETFALKYQKHQYESEDEKIQLYNILSSFTAYMRHVYSVAIQSKNYDKAQKATSSIINIEENILAEPASFEPYSMLGLASMLKKDYSSAEKYFTKSYHIAYESQDTTKMAEANLSLFRIYMYNSDTSSKAKQKLSEAYNLITTYSFHSMQKAEVLAEMADIYKRIQNYEVAYQLIYQSYLEKIHCGHKFSDEDYIKTAEIRTGYLPLMGDSALLRHIQEIAEREIDSRNVQKASELMGVHHVVCLEEFEKGIFYYQKAATIAHNLQDSVSEAKNMAEIGTILFACKRYDEALTYMQKAEKTNKNLKYRELVSLMAYVHNDSLVKERLPYLYDITTAELKKKMLSTNTAGREWMVAFMPYDIFRSMPYYYKNLPECADIAYNSALLYKGLLQNTQKSISEYITNCDNPVLKEQYSRLQILHNLIQTDSKLTSEEKMQQQIEATNLELSILEKLSQKKMLSNLGITWDKVCKRLSNNDVAIEFVEINNLEPLNHSAFYYGALVLRKGYKHPIFVELCPKDGLDESIVLLIHSFNSGSRLTSSKWKTISEQLYIKIWGKLEDYIHPGDNVYFSAAGMLHQAPIEVIGCSDGTLANERYNLYRLSSTRELCKKEKRNLASVTLYGGLIYEDVKNPQKDSLQYDVFVAPADSLSRTGWDYLPSTLVEIKQIATQLDSLKIPVTMYEGKNGTEKSFRELSGTDISVLHIATHGFFFNNKDLYTQNYYTKTSQNLEYLSPMRRTGLMMAGGLPTWLGTTALKQENDGVLLAEEIASLDFSHTNLVVLSACQTGLGDIDNKGEGVFGIQRAFKLAGVNSLLMTLGKVDDKATQLFMDCFYKQLIKGESINRAFHYAQNYVRNYEYEVDGIKMNYKNPKFWAPFILLDGIN